MHSTLFGEEDHHSISPANSLDLSKLATDGVIRTDVCNTARKISQLLYAEVKQATRTKMQATLAEGMLRIFAIFCLYISMPMR